MALSLILENMMQEWFESKGVDPAVQSLFEAAGFLDLASLQANRPEHIHAELSKANAMLKLAEREPSLEEIAQWCEVELAAEPVAPQQPENAVEASVEERAEPAEERVAVALPVSADYLEAHGVVVTDLPKAQPVAGASRSSKSPIQPAPQPNPEEENAAAGNFKSLDDLRMPEFEQDERSIVRSTKEETNVGVDPGSRKFIRGVLHNDAQRTYWGAWGFIVASVLLVCALVPVVYILIETKHYLWGFATPALLLVALMVYVCLARKSSCPVCRQRQFVPKACHKHVKAHKWPVLGHMLPTALHLVCFKWFRCIFCGTAIRVKE